MASNSCSFSVKYTFPIRLTIIVLLLSNAVAAVPEREIESMIAALRARGYSLFGNAVATSDIYYEVLSGTSFTFFAPTDSSLFALDMTATAPDYTAALRRHAVPRRLSLADLRALPSGSTLPTLVPRHDIRVQRRPDSHIVTANGVDVIVPGLFYGRDIAVHGLGGILSYRSQIGPHHGLPAPPTEAGDRQSPHPKANLYGHHGYWAPDHHGPPPPEIFSGNHDRPGLVHPHSPSPANSFYYGTTLPPSAFVPPVLKPPSFDHFSPVHSPGTAGVKFDIEFSPESSISPALAPSTSIVDAHPDPGEGWAPTQPVLTPTAVSGITETASTVDIPWRFDPETLDCPDQEEEREEALLGHVGFQPGNPLRLQHHAIPSLTCARR